MLIADLAVAVVLPDRKRRREVPVKGIVGDRLRGFVGLGASRLEVVLRLGRAGAVEEVFYKALKGIDGYEERGVPFVAWLYTIARNVVCDRARQAGREEPLDDSNEPSSFDDVERRALLFRLVDTLPTAQRDVLVARFAEQRSIADVARQLGRSEGAIKQLQLRAIEALRAQVRGSHG